MQETFSAGEYARLARAEIDAALDGGRRPLVVGGTGLYLQAALTDLELRPPPPPDLRARIEARVAAEGPEAVHAELAARAPATAARIGPGDASRVIRALELIEMGEEPAPQGDDSRLWTAALRRPTLLCGLVMQRSALYERIDERVERMVAAGAADEVRRARPRRRLADRAQGAGLRGAARGRRRGHEAAQQELRQTTAHMDAQADRGHRAST